MKLKFLFIKFWSKTHHYPHFHQRQIENNFKNPLIKSISGKAKENSPPKKKSMKMHKANFSHSFTSRALRKLNGNSIIIKMNIVGMDGWVKQRNLEWNERQTIHFCSFLEIISLLKWSNIALKIESFISFFEFILFWYWTEFFEFYY